MTIALAGIRLESDGTLSRSGKSVRLPPRQHSLLMCLASHPGALVSQEQIITEVWPGVTVVEPGSVHQAVKRLREALDSLQPDTEFIETIPKRGYRLLVPVESVLPAPILESPVKGVLPGSTPPPPRQGGPHNARRAWILGFVGSAAALAGGSLTLRDRWSSARARELHLEGLKLWKTRRYFACVQALKKFEEAVRLDPQFALAWVGIANCHLFAAPEPPDAEAAVRQALSINPQCGEAYASFGFLHMVHRWDWPAAQLNFDRALQLAPLDPTTNHWFGVYHSCLRRFELAHDGLSRAAKLDPASPAIRSDLLRVRFQLGEKEAALKGWRELLREDFGFALGHLVWHLCSLERYEEAIRAWIAGESQIHQPDRIKFLERYGWERSVERIIASLDPIGSAYQIAQWNALLRRDRQCLDKLQQAAKVDRFSLFEIHLDVAFDRVRSQPDFQAFVASLKFPSLA